jgi:hypothetical protein
MNLFIVLTGHWFTETATGRKRIEYRKMSPFWTRRIWENREAIKTVTFARGYTRASLTYNVTKIDVGPCPIEGWQGDYYRIHFTAL